ncbi:MAG: hypothetical protein GX418_04265 [Clostridiales bacterium]|nr:hypothetical protein [Clostridiales bacterium]
MPDEIFELVSQGARYWFLFLMVLIVWRSYRWLARDRRQRKKRLRLLPDAGYVGELVVLRGNEELETGLALPVSGEGVLGSVRGDDVYVPVRGVRRKHLWFTFDEDQGLCMEPYGRQRIEVDGRTYTGRRARAFLAHGSRLTVGEAELRLRLFAGYEFAGARAATEAAPTQAPDTAQTAFTPEQLAAFRQLQAAAWQAAPQPNGPTAPFPGDAPQQGFAPAQQPGTAAPYPQGAAPPDTRDASGAMAPAAVSATLSTERGDFALPPRMGAGHALLPPEPAEEDEAEPVYGDAQEPFGEEEPVPDYGAETEPAYRVPSPAEPRGSLYAESATARRRRVRLNPLPPLNEGGIPSEDPYRGAAAGWNGTTDGGGWAQADPDGETADALWERAHSAERAPALRRVPDEADAPWAASGAPVPGGATFAPRVTFYPPVAENDADADAPPYEDEPVRRAREGASLPGGEPGAPGAYADYIGAEPAGTEDPAGDWPYAAYPQSEARFADGGYTYPEYVEPEIDEPYEYADEDEAPRSLYVDPDEAARAKKMLWDRYLKGGRRG